MSENEEFNIELAKDSIREVFAGLELEESHQLIKWAIEYLKNTPAEIISSAAKTPKTGKLLKKKRETLKNISIFFKERDIVKPSNETNQVNWPETGFDSDCNKANTLEIDAFVYDDDDIEDFVEQRVLSRSFCKKCNSREIEQLNFISHSLEKNQIEFIFTKLMPKETSQVLDIGSWIGGVIYGSSIFTNGSVRTIGVEMNKEKAELTKDTIRQFGLQNVEVINDDIRNLPKIVQSSDFIIMNNVFSFFHSVSEQADCWEFLKNNIRPGTVLIHHPSVQKSVEHLKLSFNVENWLKLEDTTVQCIDFAGQNVEVYEEMDSIKKYIVQDFSSCTK